jgi:multisubunit Na+/H+ antiporter MnhC subunit
MRRSERKIRRKRINAIQDLAIQWGIMAFMSILVLIGIFQVDKFQMTKVIGPLANGASISIEISNCREDEYVNCGHIDTTSISNQITKLMEERREKYYNNSDAVISFVTTQHALVKMPFFLLAVIIVIAVTAFPVAFLWEVYKHYWREFRRRWRRINESSAKPKR